MLNTYRFILIHLRWPNRLILIYFDGQHVHLTYLRNIVQILADLRHVIGAIEESLAVELPSRVATGSFDHGANVEVGLAPQDEHLLGLRGFGFDGGGAGSIG